MVALSLWSLTVTSSYSSRSFLNLCTRLTRNTKIYIEQATNPDHPSNRNKTANKYRTLKTLTRTYAILYGYESIFYISTCMSLDILAKVSTLEFDDSEDCNDFYMIASQMQRCSFIPSDFSFLSERRERKGLRSLMVIEMEMRMRLGVDVNCLDAMLRKM